MNIPESELKILWALSGNRCAKCDSPLVQLSKEDGLFNIGEQAHIMARNSGGPRAIDGNKNNNSFDNIIILCSSCHTEIDRCPKKYTIQKLKEIKQKHEKKQLQYQHENNIYEIFINEWEKMCFINGWEYITENFCMYGTQMLPIDFVENMNEFNVYLHKVLTNNIFSHRDINRSFFEFSSIFQDLNILYKEHCIPYGDIYQVEKFYNKTNNLKEYEEYREKLVSLMIDLTKEGNHIIDLIRLHIDCRYRWQEGYLACHMGDIFNPYIIIPRYDD